MDRKSSFPFSLFPFFLFLLPVHVILLCAAASAATFTRIDGQTVAGELQAIDAKGVMTIQPDKPADKPAPPPVLIPADELMRAEFAEDREPAEPLEGVVLYLPDGDRICGTLLKSSASRVEVQTIALGPVALPIEQLLAIEFRRSGGQPKSTDELRTALLANNTKDDVSFSANGDRLAGILTAFEDAGVTMKTPLGEMKLKTDKLFGISFAARKRPPPPASLLLVARCSDGSVVTGRPLESARGHLRLALNAGIEVDIPIAALLDLGVRQGKLVYLSDLKPEDESYTPFFGGDPTWPYQRDRNYDHKPLRIAGKTYRKGLGTFSGMKLTYALGGQFKKLSALAGIDDADANRQGNVTIRVLADGKEVFQKADLTRAGGPVKINLPMTGVKTLQLVIDFGANMNLGDLTDWADAYLIR